MSSRLSLVILPLWLCCVGSSSALFGPATSSSIVSSFIVVVYGQLFVASFSGSKPLCVCWKPTLHGLGLQNLIALMLLNGAVAFVAQQLIPKLSVVLDAIANVGAFVTTSLCLSEASPSKQLFNKFWSSPESMRLVLLSIVSCRKRKMLLLLLRMPRGFWISSIVIASSHWYLA